MELRKQFEKEMGRKTTDGDDGSCFRFNNEYVEWLESRIKKLEVEEEDYSTMVVGKKVKGITGKMPFAEKV